ncbi:G-protein-coupled receptor 4 [Diaporthe helianthi]|uniref:G-protein-coupled receptor 4 n=1 Tax=Diaporthe helianthi TaxID=158607 RepID=A0A2P5HMP0_DIAHE|nr:G-protein-coupled receptor 4 [Diaporthe helianthi]
MEEEDERSKGEYLNVGRSSRSKGPQMHIFTILQQGPSRHKETTPRPTTVIPSLDYGTLASDEVSRVRDRIRRQLRLLFIYPAVYACVWMFPLVSDVIGFGEDHHHGPYWVSVASLISLCVQGLADSIVFCVRERPWRHMQGGFWENMGSFINGLSFDSRNDIGRTREEMFHEGSRARLRREGEMEREQRANRFSQGGTSQASVSRNWWDVEPNITDIEVESQDGKGDGDERREHDMVGDRGSTQTN